MSDTLKKHTTPNELREALAKSLTVENMLAVAECYRRRISELETVCDRNYYFGLDHEKALQRIIALCGNSVERDPIYGFPRDVNDEAVNCVRRALRKSEEPAQEIVP